MAWSGAEATIGSLMRDFTQILQGGERVVTADMVSPRRLSPLSRLRALERVSAIGDIGSYYLPYVETMLQCWPGLRFPCLRRARTEVIASFMVKLSQSAGASRNHWASPSDLRWCRDPIWDRCFPAFEQLHDKDLEAYISHYYDFYYNIAEDLAARYPEHLRIFELESMNEPLGRARILEFCLPDRRHVDFDVHENIGR
jgi:hypothetical protein